MTSMTPRVALIPGGARGIGRGVALDLAQRGWKVAVAYRSSAVDGRSLVETIERDGGQALALQCDVSEPNHARDLVARVEDSWGRIDALVNAAGPYHRVNILDESDAGWRAMFANNLDAVFYLARATAPGMIQRSWGRIVNFSIARAEQLIAQPQLTAHAIAKTGVLALTRTLARELAPHGITVNAISPGFIDSGNSIPPELESVVRRIPAGYVGTVNDVVAAVRFLLSDEARYVTGSNIQIGGGWGL
ncbi:MAG TPA: SDR family oxidoreductase [Chloroflexota bacterium]|nr:SDR family oxidoreductase [Chloroflexota bacterium]